LDLRDIWREQNQGVVKVTWMTEDLLNAPNGERKEKGGRVGKRLDAVWVSKEMVVEAERAGILCTPVSDHDAVTWAIRWKKEERRGRGIWKLNSELLSEPAFVEEVRIIISKFEHKPWPARVRWQKIKEAVKKAAQNLGRERAAEKRRRREEGEREQEAVTEVLTFLLRQGTTQKKGKKKKGEEGKQEEKEVR
jgi:hypothetical protein